MSKFAKGINSKKCTGDNKNKEKLLFLNFHEVIYSISCPTLELLAVTVFEK